MAEVSEECLEDETESKSSPGARRPILSMKLYAITSRKLFPTREALLACAVSWAQGGVNYLQIREKDLGTDDLAVISAQIVQTVRGAGGGTYVLLNGSADVAVAAGCDGIHLPSGLPAEAIEKARTALEKVMPHPEISISVHTNAEARFARDHGATLALYAPVFEKWLRKESIPGKGLGALAEACRAGAPMPVYALGGVTTDNARQCLHAGAAGIAAIRLFAKDAWMALR